MASDKMNKDLLELIKKTLPETQVGLIKEALEDRENLIEENKELEDLAKAERTKREDLFKELTNLDVKHSELKQELSNTLIENKQLKEQNDEFQRRDIERRAELAEGKLDAVQTTQELFLKNTIVRETVQHHMTEETPNIQNTFANGYSQPVQVGVNKQVKPVVDNKQSTTE